MRFRTKNDYYSNQFYSYFLDGVNEDELIDDNPNIQIEYRFYMSRDLNEFVYDYKKVKDILYDENGELNKLNVTIFEKIIRIADSYKKYQKKQIMLFEKATQGFLNNDFSENIKFLAGYRYHDCSIIDINYSEEYLVIEFDDFSWDRKTKYIFKIKEFTHAVSIKELKEFEVIYEELFNIDNIIEYNILLRKWGDISEASHIEEISIVFTDIKSIEHTYYNDMSTADKSIV